MSHGRERAEKVCLNCGAQPLYDRYCHHCGQENVEPKQTVWHLISHVFNDITHFDGKFFSTLRLLLLKPGFLSDEYVKGRRTKYLDPIRMYLFISAAFFIFLFSILPGMDRVSYQKDKDLIAEVDSARVREDQDSFLIYSNPSSTQDRTYTMVIFPYRLRRTVDSYDSLQKALPPSEKVPWYQRLGERRVVAAYNAYEEDPYNFIPNVVNNFYHAFSKIFFISLPLFAFILYLLYKRKRNNLYYVTHGIFALHYYSVVFIFLFVFALLMYVCVIADWLPLWVPFLILFGLFIYLFFAMKRFYNQGWVKTIIKFFILSWAISILLVLLLSIQFMNAFFAMAH